MTEKKRIMLIGGPLDRVNISLSKTPPKLFVGGVRYTRLDDPDTGEFLDAYTRTIWDKP